MIKKNLGIVCTRVVVWGRFVFVGSYLRGLPTAEEERKQPPRNKGRGHYPLHPPPPLPADPGDAWRTRSAAQTQTPRRRGTRPCHWGGRRPSRWGGSPMWAPVVPGVSPPLHCRHHPFHASATIQVASTPSLINFSAQWEGRHRLPWICAAHSNGSHSIRASIDPHPSTSKSKPSRHGMGTPFQRQCLATFFFFLLMVLHTL